MTGFDRLVGKNLRFYLINVQIQEIYDGIAAPMLKYQRQNNWIIMTLNIHHTMDMALMWAARGDRIV